MILLAPLGRVLSSTFEGMAVPASRTVGVDSIFSGSRGVIPMTSPATAVATTEAARRIFSGRGIPSYVIADYPGYIAPRIVACIVNLACEMAQQGIASPVDLDAAVRIGLGYPAGPFEWGDSIGARRILEIVRGLHATFGDQRYHPSPWLVRRAGLSLPPSSPDRAG